MGLNNMAFAVPNADFATFLPDAGKKVAKYFGVSVKSCTFAPAKANEAHATFQHGDYSSVG